MAMIFFSNGFGIIDQTIPAKEVVERGARAALVPLAKAAGTPQFQGQFINFSKNEAIWGGLIFIAGTNAQPSPSPPRS